MYKAYLRWRHSKGFGVHSPFAYRFVTEVLRPGPYGYYAYREVEKLSGERKNVSFIKSIRFLIRLVIFLKIKRIIVFSPNKDAELTARALNIQFLLTNRKEIPKFQSGDLLMIEEVKVKNEREEGNDRDNGRQWEEIIFRAIEKGVAVFAINPSEELRSLLERPIERGLLLHDKKRLLLIPRQEMAYLNYPMTLKPLG